MAKITELTKAELVEAMKSDGRIYRFNADDNYWKRAFVLYHEARGQKLDLYCGKCVSLVKEWLEKP